MAGIELCPLLIGGKGDRAPGVFSAMFIECADENGPVIIYMFRADFNAASLP